MTPETLTAIVAAAGVVGGAAVTTGPAYLAMRRAGRQQSEAVGTSMDVLAARIEGRIDGLRNELRDDIREVRDWQTSHTAEHILLAHDLPRPPSSE